MAHLLTSRARQGLATVLLTGAFGAAASGQTVFFDHFEGNALLPHWSQPPAHHWRHSVSNSQLHVEELLNPSNYKTPMNQSGITTVITVLEGDFRVHVRMGWEANSFPQMDFLLSNTLGNSIVFGFESGNIRVSTELTGSLFFPAPPPGMHDFVVDRVGSQVTFTLDGEPLITLTGLTAGLRRFSLLFGTYYPGPTLDPLHVDLVHIVPAPGAAVVPMIAGGMAMTRRRR